MIRFICLQAFAVLFFLPGAAALDLTVKVQSITARLKGHIVADLWRSGNVAAVFPRFDTVLQNTNGEKGEKPCTWKDPNFTVCRQTVPVNASRLSLTFNDLPAGDYAVAIFHDNNEDWQFNRVASVPTEGGGFSNVPRSDLKYGYKPTFERSKFGVSERREIIVDVKYP